MSKASQPSAAADQACRIVPPAEPFDVTLRPPGSKSLTNRALLLAALADGTSTLNNVLFSDDTRRMLEALGDLGFDLHVDEPSQRVVVQGQGGRIPAKNAGLSVGNAGTAYRFLTAACCLGEGVYELDGVPRMRERPIGQLVDALRALGARIDYLGEEGYPPLRVHGGSIKGGTVDFPRAVSSQYISALLQIGPSLQSGLTVRSQAPLTSWPYVDMTIQFMGRFGADFERWQWGTPFEAAVNERNLHATDLLIEPDASSASYFLAAAALMPGARMRIDGLGPQSAQGDAMFADAVLKEMGAEVRRGEQTVEVAGPSQLAGIDIDLSDMPDMAQTLAVAALFTEETTVIRGVANLRVKETDRIAAIQNELGKLGASVTVGEDDEITIRPPMGGVLRHADGRPITRDEPALVDTYDDHRMAMSFAVAGLRQAGVVIRDPDCVNKTFPGFFNELEKLGASVTPYTGAGE